MFDARGQPKRQYVFDFDRLGCRVPAVLVSPWLAARPRREPAPAAHLGARHRAQDVGRCAPQPLTAREGQAATFDDLFESLDAPRTDCPTALVRPPLPDAEPAARPSISRCRRPSGRCSSR